MQSQSLKLTPEMVANPYPVFAALRESAPVHYVEAFRGSYVVSRHEDIAPILKNTTLFSSKMASVSALMPKELGEDVLRYFRSENSLLSSDPPQHTRLRTLVSRAFTPRRVADLEPRIRELASELLDAMLTQQEFDLMADLAVPLPIIVIAEMLGIEPERRQDFKRWSNAISQSVTLTVGGLDLEWIATGIREIHSYLEAAIERRRREPGDDLISALVTANEQQGGFLSSMDVIGFVRLLLFAGNETTTNLIGNGTLALLNHPSEMKRLAQDASLVPNAVEEMLRYDTPAQVIFRITTADTEIAGTPIPKDARIMLLLGAANRDPRKFPNPDTFDITRDTQGHVAFGHGVHFCIGGPLARLEAQVVFDELFHRVRRMSFAPGQEGQLDYGTTFSLRGPKSLRLRAERR
ncbi:cytochrome P450 [Archangium violaceum]|uniref:cytochrome P450 n=1 Tax=Archangium violaceum TaxID=83451 RepID=UPI002B286A9A|nr:cytochrome P450 [Archangium violaceum]